MPLSEVSFSCFLGGGFRLFRRRGVGNCCHLEDPFVGWGVDAFVSLTQVRLDYSLLFVFIY